MLQKQLHQLFAEKFGVKSCLPSQSSSIGLWFGLVTYELPVKASGTNHHTINVTLNGFHTSLKIVEYIQVEA